MFTHRCGVSTAPAETWAGLCFYRWPLPPFTQMTGLP